MKNLILAGLSAAFVITVIVAVNYWPQCPGCTGAVLFVEGMALGFVFRKMP